jgi:hypothetical protein
MDPRGRKEPEAPYYHNDFVLDVLSEKVVVLAKLKQLMLQTREAIADLQKEIDALRK